MPRLIGVAMTTSMDADFLAGDIVLEDIFFFFASVLEDILSMLFGCPVVDVLACSLGS